MGDSTVWMIRVAGYGTMEFTGTQAEAEEMRAHKANWERGSAMMWRKDLARESDRIGSEIAALFEQGKGVPSGMLKRRAEARKSESRISVPKREAK